MELGRLSLSLSLSSERICGAAAGAGPVSYPLPPPVSLQHFGGAGKCLCRVCRVPCAVRPAVASPSLWCLWGMRLKVCWQPRRWCSGLSLGLSSRRSRVESRMPERCSGSRPVCKIDISLKISKCGCCGASDSAGHAFFLPQVLLEELAHSDPKLALTGVPIVQWPKRDKVRSCRGGALTDRSSCCFWSRSISQ